jgi:hypothetical protein
MYYRSTLEKVLYDGVELFPSLVQNTLKEIKFFKKQFGREGTNIYCLFDNCQSAINIRKIISNNQYKSNRDKDKVPKGFYKTLDLFYYLLEFYDDNIYLLRLNSNEADDLVHPLLKYIKPDVNNRAILISVDMDWSRSISPIVDWCNYTTIYNRENFKTNYGFTPNKDKVILYKIFNGDNSDHIKPAISNLRHRESTSAMIADNFDSLDHLLENLDNTSIIKDSLKEKINKNMHKVKENHQLVQLKMVYDVFGLTLEPRMLDKNGASYFKSLKERRENKLRKY